MKTAVVRPIPGSALDSLWTKLVAGVKEFEKESGVTLRPLDRALLLNKVTDAINAWDRS